MGHLKLAPPFNVVVSPRAARTQRREAPGRLAPQSSEDTRAAEDARVAEIAQRFAPGAHIMADRTAPQGPSPELAQDPAAAPRGAAGAFKALPQSFQGLILALILIALLPSLTLNALVWFGPPELAGFAAKAPDETAQSKPAQKTHQIEPPHIKTASLVDLPFAASEPAPASAPDRIAAAETVETGQASLAAPHRLEAQAGQAVPFAIALASVEPLPSRSVIAVTGLPAGATLSAGRPYTDAEWNLRTDELAGLRLYLPEAAQGETVLEIALIAADGATLAETRTALKVIAPAPANIAAAPAPVAALPASPAHAALGPGFDPFTAPAAGDAATRVAAEPVAETQAPETQAPETQAPQAQAPQAQAQEPQHADPAQAEAAAPDVATEEPGAAEETADSDPASGPASGPTSGPAEVAVISEPTSPASGPFADSGAKTEPSVALSDFVNLRARPTSSARVIAVMAKGTKVTPTAKRRGWLKVTDSASGKTGWIYGRYAGGSAQASSQASPSRLGPSSEDSWLTRFGRWVMY